MDLKNEGKSHVLTINGTNLVMSQSDHSFPIALLNGKKMPVLNADGEKMLVEIDPIDLSHSPGQFEVALDPFAIIKMKLKPTSLEL